MIDWLRLMFNRHRQETDKKDERVEALEGRSARAISAANRAIELEFERAEQSITSDRRPVDRRPSPEPRR